MTRSSTLHLTFRERLNFLLTNRIPRYLLTRFMGWFSKLEQPLLRDLSIALWQCFTDLGLHKAKKTRFNSLHDCFIRELKEGARPVDADPAVSSGAFVTTVTDVVGNFAFLGIATLWFGLW